MMTSLTGAEQVSVLPQTEIGGPAPGPEITTTQAIANLSPVGATGPTGATGATGAAGATGATGAAPANVVQYGTTGAIPTSDPHVVGRIWSNSGTITISAG